MKNADNELFRAVKNILKEMGVKVYQKDITSVDRSFWPVLPNGRIAADHRTIYFVSMKNGDRFEILK